jgi:signal transduction histidine kinase
MNFSFLRTLRARLIVSYLFVALVGIILISILAGRSIFQSAQDQVEDRYEDLAFVASNRLEQPLADLLAGEGAVEAVRDSLQAWFASNPEVRYAVYLPDGQPLVATGETLPPPITADSAPEVQQALIADLGQGKEIRRDERGLETLYLAIRIDHGNQLYGILRLEVAVEEALAPARRSLALLLFASLVIALGVAAFGVWLAHSLSNPIDRLTRTAEQLAQGDLSARVKVPKGPRELHLLAEAINTTAARLEANLAELRNFVANASHELRTPLTSVKLRVEALRAGALEEKEVAGQFLSEIESEIDRMGRMVNDLLDLSRLETGLVSQQRAPLDLGTLAAEVCETFRARAERLGVNLRLSVEPGLPSVMGDEDQLRRVMYNLVDNAIKYTGNNGKVDVILRSGGRDQFIRFLVKDSGFGIDPKSLEHIFERFYRVEATRPRSGSPKGSGLGLSIARTIIESHGGTIQVDSRIGEGTTFLVELPSARR